MRRVKYKKPFMKERTNRVDFRRRFYKVIRKDGTIILALVRPSYFDDYGFMIIVKYGETRALIKSYKSFEVALDHVLIYLTDDCLWSRKSNANMY